MKGEVTHPYLCFVGFFLIAGQIQIQLCTQVQWTQTQVTHSRAQHPQHTRHQGEVSLDNTYKEHGLYSYRSHFLIKA